MMEREGEKVEEMADDDGLGLEREGGFKPKGPTVPKPNRPLCETKNIASKSRDGRGGGRADDRRGEL